MCFCPFVFITILELRVAIKVKLSCLNIFADYAKNNDDVIT